MAIDLKKFARHDRVDEPAFKQADEIAEALKLHLESVKIQEKMLTANAPGRSSALVQECFVDFAIELGFKNESTTLFKTYQTSALRPDYYKKLGDTGILLEVERGKTTINNMDLLDFWKCHLCEHANYLFLMVPMELRQNTSRSPRKEFNTVSKRMAAFFEPRNYTNVFGLWLFGY